MIYSFWTMEFLPENKEDLLSEDLDVIMEAEMKLETKGFDGKIVYAPEWSNLTDEPYYCLSAGTSDPARLRHLLVYLKLALQEVMLMSTMDVIGGIKEK